VNRLSIWIAWCAALSCAAFGQSPTISSLGYYYPPIAVAPGQLITVFVTGDGQGSILHRKIVNEGAFSSSGTLRALRTQAVEGGHCDHSDHRYRHLSGTMRRRPPLGEAQRHRRLSLPEDSPIVRRKSFLLSKWLNGSAVTGWKLSSMPKPSGSPVTVITTLFQEDSPEACVGGKNMRS
jgi:hypothetical protein